MTLLPAITGVLLAMGCFLSSTGGALLIFLMIPLLFTGEIGIYGFFIAILIFVALMASGNES